MVCRADGRVLPDTAERLEPESQKKPQVRQRCAAGRACPALQMQDSTATRRQGDDHRLDLTLSLEQEQTMTPLEASASLSQGFEAVDSPRT